MSRAQADASLPLPVYGMLWPWLNLMQGRYTDVSKHTAVSPSYVIQCIMLGNF